MDGRSVVPKTSFVSRVGFRHWGQSLYYVRVKGWVGGIAKYLLFLTGVKTVSPKRVIMIVHFTTISGHFLANPFNIFHKTEALLIQND